MRAAPLAHAPAAPLRLGHPVLQGLLLAGAIGLVAHLAADLAFPYALAVGFEVPLAMLLGLVVACLGGAGERVLPGIRFSARHVLALGIMLLGLRLNLQSIAVIGAEAFLLVLVCIGSAVTFAVLMGRRLGVERRVALLIGVGSSVCGNSAILAAAPVVKAGDREVGFAVATITIFGTFAVFAFPLIGHALDLDVLAFGLWSGSAVPDTAQTIASSAAYDTVGRDVATVVKLVRNVLMIPLVLLIAWIWSRHDGRVTAEAAREGARRAFPYFLVGFLALALARTLRLVDPETVADVDSITRGCFVVALAALGLQTRVGQLRTLGPRPFLLGLGTFGLLAAGSLSVIMALGLGPNRTAVAGAVDPRGAAAWIAGAAPRFERDSLTLSGRVIATGIPGAGALSPVGRFHPGGPMHDKRSFAASTRRGRVLDATRLLVASRSNFGAPRAREDWAEGAILSLATDARRPLRVPPAFAARDGQAQALGGAVQLYTAQSRAFLNRPGTVTADMPAVSDPRGISVNNAFGRPWFANATGASGAETVTDPDGRPLDDPPSERAGGVFADDATNRESQRVPGSLGAPAVGNALLGASPDTTGRAVFAVATADGALAQVHVEEGVDGLAPPGTLTPGARRVGLVFNWVPDRFLYVTDPRADAIVQLRLRDDFEIFHVAEERRLTSPLFDVPIDMAPAVPEVANPGFSSNTTLAGGSDIYVANRGSGKIVRLRQDGRVRAVARVRAPGLGLVRGGMLNGIAVSPDAATIWLSVGDSIVQAPAFGAPR